MKYLRVLCASAALAGLSLVPTMASAESLKAALASAYANNPSIASALLSVKAASEGIAARKAGTRPQISASATATDSWSVSGGATSTSQTFRLGVDYQQVLFDNMKTASQVEQARALADVAAQALRNAEQNVLLSAATAYMDVVRYTRLVQLRAENVKFYKAQVQSAQDRLRIGEGTKIDVAQADTSLAQAVASYKTAVNSLQSAQASYMRWVGHKPHNLDMNIGTLGKIPASIDVALASADQHHPAILTAQAQIRAAQSASDAAKAAFGPTLSLIGSICGVNCGPGTATGASGSVSLKLSIPIYAGGAIGAGVRSANLDQIKSEVDAQATRAQVQEAVIASWTGMQTASAQIDSAQQAVKSAQLALDGVIQERDVGQQTTLDVLNARASLTQAQEALITAQSGKITASFALEAATGRLSASDLNLPVELKSADGYRAKVEDIWAELRAVAQ
ncbi:MAG TPA: TolC family outer membrane protein [Devosiaceae bacterium]